jgi:hypothetical protein
MAHVKGPIELDHLVWLTDLELRATNPYDRGILIDLMCISVNGSPPGFLALKSGEPIPDENIAQACHITLEKWQGSKARLLRGNRIVEGDKGVLYIPKMVKDFQVRTLARDGGKKGGNPELIKDREPVEEKVAALTFRMLWNAVPSALQIEDVKVALQDYWEMRQRKKYVWTMRGVKSNMTSLAMLKPKDVVRAIRCSTEKNWRAIYPAPNWWQDKEARATSIERVQENMASIESKLKEDRERSRFETSVSVIVDELNRAVELQRTGISSDAMARALSGLRDRYRDLELDGKNAVDQALEIVEGMKALRGEE